MSHTVSVKSEEDRRTLQAQLMQHLADVHASTALPVDADPESATMNNEVEIEELDKNLREARRIGA